MGVGVAEAVGLAEADADAVAEAVLVALGMADALELAEAVVAVAWAACGTAQAAQPAVRVAAEASVEKMTARVLTS